MTTGSGSPFSAVDATLGYLYQVRSALLWALRRQKSEPDFLVSVETLDDVTFETAGSNPTDLLQTKHHRKGSASLTDASPDLWKTLRIWFEGHASGQIPTTANLYLVTTSAAPDGTAASRLRAASRDLAAAQDALDATAASSTNQTNMSAYAAYLKATSAERTAILSKIIIVDAAPTVADLDGELRQEVYWAAGKEHHAAFLDRLEGWWLRRILRQLTDGPQDRVGSVELEAQMSDLREQFKQEALPIDEDLREFTLDDATKAALEDSTFVRQLAIIRAGKRRIVAAIRDYYRAFEQRSRWIRDDLVVGLDLHEYEKRLCEEWELVFEAMRDDVGDTATDEAQEQAARSVLAWAERTTIPIRPSVTEPFVSRGSLHMLSDEVRIGWHPEFRARIESLLSAKEDTA
jgi:hypothetical protein